MICTHLREGQSCLSHPEGLWTAVHGHMAAPHLGRGQLTHWWATSLEKLPVGRWGGVGYTSRSVANDTKEGCLAVQSHQVRPQQ